MIESIELQVISKILTSQDEDDVNKLLSFDDTYYSVFRRHIQFIFNHKARYGVIPDVFTFLNEFQDIETLVDVQEPVQYLCNQLRLNKKRIILVETVNRIKDADESQIDNVWGYIRAQVSRVDVLENTQPMDIVHTTQERSDMIQEYNRRPRIPTGIPEIDACMYGGMSTVEELVVLAARTNSGKSWLCTKMMESAQRHGFPVLYYSPEMQAAMLATRFDTWRAGYGKFKNSDIFRGQYNEEYLKYLSNLQTESTPAFILEDKDVENGVVNATKLQTFIHQHKIQLLIIDGLSYMEDEQHASATHEQYKNICASLFKMSKTEGCVVVIAMQANRDTKKNKSDEDGVDPFPSLYELEGSDHPARIATQVFSIRNVYDQGRLDIRMEKSRNAANNRSVFLYRWDPNNGEMSLLDDTTSDSISNSISPNVTPVVVTTKIHKDDDNDLIDDDDEFEEGIKF